MSWILCQQFNLRKIFVLSLRCSVVLSFCRSFNLSLRFSVALSLCRSVALSLYCFVAPSLWPSVAPSIFRSIYSSLHNYSFSFFYFSIQSYPQNERCGDELDCADVGGPAGYTGGNGAGVREVSGSESSPRVRCPRTRLRGSIRSVRELSPGRPFGIGTTSLPAVAMGTTFATTEESPLADQIKGAVSNPKPDGGLQRLTRFTGRTLTTYPRG